MAGIINQKAIKNLVYPSVTAAESAYFNDGELACIAGYNYSYFSSSTETADGITVLNTASGGKLHIQDQSLITGDHTGFVSPSSVTCTHDYAYRKVALTGDTSAYYKGKIVSELISGWESPQYSSDLSAGVYVLVYNGSFSWISITSLDYSYLIICYFIKTFLGDKKTYKNLSNVLYTNGQRDYLNTLVGSYIVSGGILYDYVLDSTTTSDRRPHITEVILRNIDSETVVDALTDSYLYICYLSSSSNFNISYYGDIVRVSGSQPYYNLYSGGTWSSQLLPSDKFITVFLIASSVNPDANGSNDYRRRFLFLQSQGYYDSLSEAKAVDWSAVTLGELSSYPAFVPRARIVIYYDGLDWVIKSVDVIGGCSKVGFINKSSIESSYINDHLLIDNIQGNGQYHLSLSERDAAIRLATPSQSGLMSASYAGSLELNNEITQALLYDVSVNDFTVSETIVDGVWTVTITQNSNENLKFFIAGEYLEHTSDSMSVIATSYAGTDTSPNIVYVYVKNDSGSPLLVASNTPPEGSISHVDCVIINSGAISTSSRTKLGYFSEVLTDDKLLTKLWHTELEEGVSHRSGLTHSATTTALTTASGTVRAAFNIVNIGSLVTSTDGFYHILNSGTWEYRTNFQFSQYGDGNTIGVSKYYCVVFGVMLDSPTCKLFAIVQDKPSTEYYSAQTAYNDEEEKRVTAPSNEFLKISFLPICFVIIQNISPYNLVSIGSSYSHSITTVGGSASQFPVSVTSPITGNGTISNPLALKTPWMAFTETEFADEFSTYPSKELGYYSSGGSLTYGSGVFTFYSGTTPWVAVLNSGGTRFLDCKVRLKAVLQNASAYISLKLHYDDGVNGNFYEAKFIPGSPGSVILSRYTNWSPTTLASSSSIQINLSTEYTFEIESVGDLIRLRFNNGSSTYTYSATDTNYPEGTVDVRIGLDSDNTTGGYMTYLGIFKPIKFDTY